MALGFPYYPQKEGKSKIDIKIARYQVELQSLYHLIPSHIALLHNALSPHSAEESRKRLVKQYFSVPFEELAAYATDVFLHKQARLRHIFTAEQWAEELLLWQKEHALMQKDY